MQKAGVIMRHKKSVMRSFMMVTQLGISVMVPVFVCILAGYYIDRFAGTKLTLFFMFLGFLAGGLNAYKLAKATLAVNEREERAEDQKERMERQVEAEPKVHKPKQPSRVKEHDDEKLS
jgi:F0F1-type ATP synthase assembly protein I